MIFTLQPNSTIYLATDAASATAGFLFATAPSSPPNTYELTSSSWNAAQPGFFAFFEPAAQRDWGAFATALWNQLNTQGAQFGWFTGPDASPTLSASFMLSGQSLTSATAFSFPPPPVNQPVQGSSLQLQLQVSRASIPTVVFDDASESFQIPNTPEGTALANLQLNAATGSQQNTLQSTSDNVVLPMSGLLAGTLQCSFQAALSDLAIVEAGLSYFGPAPSKQSTLLNALSFPVVRPAGSAKLFNLAGSFDPVQQTNGERTFLQITDAQLGSYFASATGQPFDLVTVPSSNVADVARFVFANRPVTDPTDATNYYLALAGRLDFAPHTPQATSNGGPPTLTNALLCGVQGTEFFTVSPGDTLRFVPNQAAWDNSAAGDSSKTLVAAPVANTNIVTSWVSYEPATAGTYVSQPQPSPLFNGGTSAPLGGSGNGESGGNGNGTNNVYVLDFYPMAAWTAAATNTAAVAGPPAPAPLVPLVPFAGIVQTTPQQQPVSMAPFTAIEVNAIYPQRRTNFVGVAKQQAAANPAPAATLQDITGYAMTPQGLIAGLAGNRWATLQLAQTPPWVDSGGQAHAGLLQLTRLGTEIIAALQQSQVFLVASTTQNDTLFGFTDPTNPNLSDDGVNIADWMFSLSPDGAAGPALTGEDVPPILAGVPVPPVLMLKFHNGVTIKDLVDSLASWTSPDVFNVGSGNSGFTAEQAQAYAQLTIARAEADVAKNGNASIYANFVTIVTDPNFNGLLALNCNIQLNNLPGAIKGVLGGMTDPDISAFRAHHVGVAINDTDSKQPDLVMTQSAMFGLVDYEWNKYDQPAGLFGFQVEYMRALFMNAELRQFACKIDLTLNNLFNVGVSLTNGITPNPNVLAVNGSYQAHSTTGDKTTSGVGVYSFVAEGNFVFNFTGTALENPYLQTITLTKLQFSFDDENVSPGNPQIFSIASSFAVWGSMVFKELDVLDVFSFESLSFSDVKLGVKFNLDLTAATPSTNGLALSFSPGDLRFDFGQTKNKSTSSSMLALLPFKLTSFLYSENADETLESLGYIKVSGLPSGFGPDLLDTFNYALIFDLDLGSVGALVGSLAAFKFSVIVGWQIENLNPTPPNPTIPASGIAFGVKLPEADGKLEIKIEGVLDLLIEEFILKFLPATATQQEALVVVLHNLSVTVLGKKLPPAGAMDLALFVPEGPTAPPLGATGKIGWIVAYNKAAQEAPMALTGDAPPTDQPKDSPPAFDLKYLGLGQRIGPSAKDTPTNFADFKTWLTGKLWEHFKAGEYDLVYHSDGKWLAIVDVVLLGKLELGLVFYDMTPFYALSVTLPTIGAAFEITYTKISDSIGMYYANLTLPDSLRTFQVGVASVTMPSIAVSVYTNGNFKVDLGFPVGTDWSGCFQIQAQAGPVPVTGSGGFYIASLSSATDPGVFTQTDYGSILAFGFAARLGVGKDFSMGPLSAGVSVTFFGIIEGAVGYLQGGDIFSKPDALSLTGNFGIIGQLYGTLDFKIVTASVNVTLSASIGITMKFEPGQTANILLYIEASVEVSVSLSINLGLFSISISFSFSASIHLQWQLSGSSSQNDVRLGGAARAAFALTTDTILAPIGILPGLEPVLTALPVWFLPEVTVVFADTTTAGTPYVVTSLSLQYNATPSGTSSYASFSPFEALTTQLATWALMQALGLSYDSVVTLAQLTSVDQCTDLENNPDPLAAWLDYPTLLAQLQMFTATVTVPTAAAGSTVSAAVFPMPGFMHLATTGRTDGTNPADLSFTFDGQNVVSQAYIAALETQFEQMSVNRSTQQSSQMLEATATATMALADAVFLEYFKGLIRGAVHELTQNLRASGSTSIALNTLFINTVASGGFAALSGLMSASFRGGAQLPYTAGLTVAPGTAVAPNTSTALYALLWQEFPAGGLSGTTPQYTIALSNPSTAPNTTWIGSTVTWALTQDFLTPYQGITATQIPLPALSSVMPLTNTGPQSFTFASLVTWTGPSPAGGTISPFAPALQRLQAASAGTPIDVVVQQRTPGAPLTSGTALPASGFVWATQVNLTVKTIPSGPAGAGGYVQNVYALSGANAADELLLQQIVTMLRLAQPPFSIKSIDVLFQSAPNAPGLQSLTVTPSNVFVLRTNTTTVSAPPTQLLSLAFAARAEGVPVGATIADAADFLQIIQQAVVTNAGGYYLQYVDSTGKVTFPQALLARGIAPVTLLIQWNPDPNHSGNSSTSPAQVQPFYNAVVLTGTVDSSQVYYAETTDASDTIQYPAVAPGAYGVELTASNTATMLVPANSKAAPALGTTTPYTLQAIVAALIAAGVTTETEMYQQIALIGTAAGAAQLNALYALLTFQIQAAGGFVASPLSPPIQPQNPGSVTSPPRPRPMALATTATQQIYPLFAPLYNFATANQNLPANTPPNRYAGIGTDSTGAFTIDVFLNDAFGNQLPGNVPVTAQNLYFDPLVPVDQWTGIVPSYDFGVTADPNRKPAAGTFEVVLTPSAQYFAGWTATQFLQALQHYQTIDTQVHGPGVSFYVETNFALDANGHMAQIPLATSQMTAFVDAMLAYLAANAGLTPPAPAATIPNPLILTLTIPAGGAALPPVFELSALIGIQRDPNLIAPSLKNGTTILYPAAQNVASAITPNIAAASAQSNANDVRGTTKPPPELVAFAATFTTALPALTLSVGLNGAQAPQNASSARRARKKLKALGVASDGGSGGSSPQSLFAVQTVLLDVSIGTTPGSGPFYASPTPLDNQLNSDTVAMPVIPPELIKENAKALPDSRVFTDVDLDQLNSAFFTAVDNFLDPASAAQAFALAQSGKADAYTPVATGREKLAHKYTKFEIDWMFAPGAPFTPSDASLLQEGKDAFEQQMRAALGSAYLLDTIVQYQVAWNGTVPGSVGDRVELFGQIAPSAKDTNDPAVLAKITLSTAHLPVPASGNGLLTFLFGSSDVKDLKDDLAIDLQYDVTHVQYFLADESVTPSGEARPSIWLQLVNPYDGQDPPHVGPASTTIPVVFRQYPAPPTFIAQQAVSQPTVTTPNPLIGAAAWDYTYRYQAQITGFDQLLTSITYNTNLAAASGGGNQNGKLFADAETTYSLFHALARFTAAYAILRPFLANLADANWEAAATLFAQLVTDVVNNSDWAESAFALASPRPLQFTVDDYVVTDVPKDDSDPSSPRTITMTWQPPLQQQSSWDTATLQIEGIAPDQTVYPGQTSTTTSTEITDVYTPTAAVVNNWVGHQISVDALNVLAAENALAALQIQRNAISLPYPPTGNQQTQYPIQTEYVYTTPVVRPSQPATPFIDNLEYIAITSLPAVAPATTCPEQSSTSLCQLIYTTMCDLLREDVHFRALQGVLSTSNTPVTRRVKVGCNFQYPVVAVAGVTIDPVTDPNNPIMPVIPVVLARSFVVDVSTVDQIAAFAQAFATAVIAWCGPNGVTFGPAAAPTGGLLLFDVTLYAELSGTNTPVLRLRNLYLKLSEIDPVSTHLAPNAIAADPAAS